MISIHAPRVGRDYKGVSQRWLAQFQSTRPVWGATIRDANKITHTPISIHAPRVGRDGTDEKASPRDHISIHAPRVGRDHYCATAREYYAISIHAPRVGRDLRKRDFRDIVSAISIHAPRVGRDDEEGEESNV